MKVTHNGAKWGIENKKFEIRHASPFAEAKTISLIKEGSKRKGQVDQVSQIQPTNL